MIGAVAGLFAANLLLHTDLFLQLGAGTMVLVTSFVGYLASFRFSRLETGTIAWRFGLYLTLFFVTLYICIKVLDLQ